MLSPFKDEQPSYAGESNMKKLPMGVTYVSGGVPKETLYGDK